MNTNSLSPAADRPRKILGGRPLGDNRYELTLDGGEIVETTAELFKAARQASESGKQIVATIEEHDGDAILVELQIASASPAPLAAQVPPTTSTAQPASTALAPVGPTSGLLHDPVEFIKAQAQWENDRFHIVNRFGDFSSLPKHYAIGWATVKIRLNDAAKEVYRDPLWCKEDEVALAKNGLSRIAQAAGLSISTHRMDGRMIPNYWEVKAVATMRNLDGSEVSVEATEELDLREGSDRAAKVMGRNNARGALIAARSKGMRNCEARAINAVIRLVAAIPQSYKRADLEKPFIIVKPVFNPDMADPAIAAIVTDRAMGGRSTFYPASQSLPEPKGEHLDTIGDTPGRVIDVPARQVEAGFGASAPTTSTVAAPAAPVDPPGQTRIAEIKTLTGEGARGPWLLYKVTFTNSQKAITFNAGMQATADAAKAKNLPVKYTTKPGEGDRDDTLVTLEIVDTRQGSLPMADTEKY